MSSVHRSGRAGPMLYACAQAGCQACVERLLRQHAGLVHWVIHRACGSDLPYGELLHEGQIALWHAIRHYDSGRGVAFSTYAVSAIRYRLWDVVARAQRPPGYPALPPVGDPAALAATAWQRQAVRTALQAALRSLSGVALSSAASCVSVAQAAWRLQLNARRLSEHLNWGIPNQRF